mmetsp:Transcript_8197/g.10955  ORF Transcript_8197/g.10955 Transcript_8197/m.10955 type:complete len:134 (+) Transcript_8197:74-475(+)|eukprot:CAMPEP_0201487820 /NCGR_PEP_ID=MMETSP0151_2-20130828/15502_1 /ASSEMBLY_ACC=CAM_ASM_000257 /TAXON_ID=200890 /ORGANISM="Paramoeba atlantica, Strain 621/1 / CCAP 1560/9" /LENGTH=133 /DNA_ID=CAMNT_0047872973 /DNA_START=53 /DNA_END=454 /DNA_ORIENTATION=+
MKILKPGKVVLMLQGRHAGKKGVVVQTTERGTKSRPYGHAVIVGVSEYPRKVHKRMSRKTIANRSRVKPFVRVVNHNHIFPTRYNMEIVGELKGKINLTDETHRKDTRRDVRAVLEERYKSGRNQWFFQALRF